MTAMLCLVVDTNLFHEYRKLEELPWSEIDEAEEIVLIVTDPVQTELDEQKKSPRARIKRRALDWTKRFRELILADQTDLVVNEAAPRVILRLNDTRPDPNHDDVLDRSVADDCIVAIAVVLQTDYPKAKFAVFSDDLRPLRKARQVSLKAMQIPEEWRRQPEQTNEDRERNQLERELADLRKQEPSLGLLCSEETPFEVVLPVYEPLSEQETDALIETVAELYPMETDFEKARGLSPMRGALYDALSLKRSEFRHAPDEDIEEYREVNYPNWLASCRVRLECAHVALQDAAQRFVLRFELRNDGTRPADDVQVTFKANGPLRIMPAPDHADCDEEEDAKGWSLLEGFVLPNPPSAPQGKWVTIDPLNMLNMSRWHGDHLAKPYLGNTLHDVIRGTQRDPNAFYYRSRPSEPVESYSLTCAQFRHADEVEVFDVLVLPQIDQRAEGVTAAAIEIACHASNLSRPATHTLSLRFTVEQRSTYDVLREAIAQQPFSLPNDFE